MSFGMVSVEAQPTAAQNSIQEFGRDALVSVADAAALLSVTDRAIRKAIAKGSYKAVKALDNGHYQHRIHLSSLPEQVQARYWIQQIKTVPASERRAALLSQNTSELVQRKAARLAGIKRRDEKLSPLPWTQEEFEAKGDAFSRMPGGVQNEAKRRMLILVGFVDDIINNPRLGSLRSEFVNRFAKEHGTSKTALYEWHSKVKHLERHQWLYALAPDWGTAGRTRAEISEEIWQFILNEWGTTSQPALKPIYRRARAIAEKNGFTLPSYDAVKKKVANLPGASKVFLREGEKALADLYPPQERDYSDIGLHEIWNSDGRMVDVHCRWPDGTVSRPIIVAWMDIRSRLIAGWEYGKSESALLVRQSFSNALHRTRVVPAKAYLDNGKAYASKQMTGGQATRNRFKINPEDIDGVLTLVGTKVTWAKPYNGRAKPIESFWRTGAQVDKRSEFVGAYTGKDPTERPDEHDIANAVPVELHMAAFAEEVEAYNRREHRGDAMNGRSPMQVCEDLMQNTVLRQPTAQQLKCCLMAAESVKLDRNFAVRVLGNRYWSEGLAALVSKGPYTVRYDPNDATQPVHLFDGDKFLMMVPLIAKTGFMDGEAKQTHARAQSTFKKAEKLKVKSLREMDAAQSWETPRAPSNVDPATGEIMPRPKVAAPLKPTKDYRPAKTAPATPSGEIGFTKEQFDEARAKGERLRFG